MLQIREFVLRKLEIIILNSRLIYVCFLLLYNYFNCVVGGEINTAESCQFDLGTIRAAKNNFSHRNRLGEGGFGEVYQGTLLDGQQVAMKRLSSGSSQGAKEFKNEVILVAKLQHKNLVRLLGFCSERDEKILVYEFVKNKSLDHFLFDSKNEVKLDWSSRYKIVGGIARGMMYLHDSWFKIIYCDLKASNILLDEEMNPKIADFGMERIFGVDQTEGNTRSCGHVWLHASRICNAWTFLYEGTDVFSLGVMILEIVTGKKNSSFYNSDHSYQNLLSYAWKYWRDGTPLELLDQNLRDCYSRNEVTRCVHIALLCVQEDADERPTMQSIVLMLSSIHSSVTMASPQKPAFFVHGHAICSIWSST